MGKADRANAFNQWRKGEGVTIHDCYDQFGRQINVGDFVILDQHGTVIWRVTESKPIMRPDAPPGLVQLTMAAVTQIGVQGGAPLPGIIKVRDALEYLTPEQLEAYMIEAKKGGGGVALPGTEAGGSPPPPEGEGDVSEPPPPPTEPSRIILP